MKLLLISIILFVFSNSLFSQENGALELLKNERLERKNTNQSYSDLEREFASTGLYPDALVQLTETVGKTMYTFFAYKHITSDNVDRIKSRVLSVYPMISELTITENKIDFTVPSTCEQETVLSIFNLFGYTGFTQTTFE